MIVAMMQPTYLPWIGYLDLIDQVDRFVLLDTVQFERQSWQNRNRIKTAQGVKWLTVPVHRAFGQSIMETRVQSSDPWRVKHLETIRYAYGKTPRWGQLGPTFQQAYEHPCEYLHELNAALLVVLLDGFGIEAAAKITRASALEVDGGRTELLVNICKMLGADVYLSTPGSAAYLAQDNPFPGAGIELRYHVYQHPSYRQSYGEFVPYLSSIDLLLNEPNDALSILRSGRRPNSSKPPLVSSPLTSRVQSGDARRTTIHPQ